MHLPWYQIDEDAYVRAENLGRRLGLTGPHGVGIAIAVWRWAFKAAPDGDFSGRNVDGDSLVAAAEWPANDGPRLLGALQAVGFLAAHPEPRIRGLDRYEVAWRKNSRGRQKPKPLEIDDVPRGNHAANDVKTKPQTQTQTQTHIEDLSPSKSRNQPRKKVRRLSVSEEFHAWFEARRAEKTKTSDEALTPRGINSVFGRPLSDIGRTQLELKALAYFDEPDGAFKQPPWPWRLFVARYRGIQPRPANSQPTVLSARERRDLYGANTG